jgi:hypothetical protein
MRIRRRRGSSRYHDPVLIRAAQEGSMVKTKSAHSATCLTLAEYAQAKALPEDFLKKLGLSTINLPDRMAVKIPYMDDGGAVVSARFRFSMDPSGPRFAWRTGSKLCPYGLWRLADARKAGYVCIDEGESDTQTLWLHGIPAIGLPGANSWKEDATLRPTKSPRGLILSTGEDIPRGHSTRARLLVVELTENNLDWKRLTACQEEARKGLYAKALAAHLQWLAARHDSLQSEFRPQVAKLRPWPLNQRPTSARPISWHNLPWACGRF